MLRLRKRAALVAPVALLAIGVAACGSSSGTSSKKQATNTKVKDGGSLTFASEKIPDGFNTNTSAGSVFDTQLILDPILPWAFNDQPDITVKMNTDLLDSAEQTSTSPQTIVYKIKQNASWSDGVPISAEDFMYNWQHQNGSNPKDDAANTVGYQDIDTVTGSDNGKTVTVKFKKSFGDWKALFTTIFPKHYMDAHGGWIDAVKEGPPTISGGPFILSSYNKGNNLTLMRNDKYYGQRAQALSKLNGSAVRLAGSTAVSAVNGAHLDSIVYRFITDSQAEPQALQNNEVQFIYPQPQLDLVAAVQKIQGVHQETNFGLQFEHVDYNYKNSFLADPMVRKAISTGIDRQELLNATVKQFSNKAQVLNNRIFLPGQKGYQDNSGGIGKGDVKGAQQILESDGYTKGPDGTYQKDGKRLSMRIGSTKGNKLRENEVSIIRDQMKKVGVDLVETNFTKLGSTLAKGDFDVVIFAWVGTPFPISSNESIYESPNDQTGAGGQNFGGYKNPQVDSMFKQAVEELDPAKAIQEANQVDKQIWMDSATLPLYQKPTFTAYYDKYANIVDNPTQQGPFFNTAQWGLKAS